MGFFRHFYRKFFILVMAYIGMGSYSQIALADCRATSFVHDFKSGFESESQAHDWCFQRVRWWQLNQGGDWKARFCRFDRFGSDYDGWKWNGQFRHKHHEFRSRHVSGLFGLFERHYSNRLFRGWSGRIEFIFEDRCRDGGYGYDEELDDTIIYD